MTPEQRIAQAQADHATLEVIYYHEAAITKEEFDYLHRQIWDSLAHDLNDMGYAYPETNWQELWDTSPGAIDKITILARMLGLETIDHPLPPNYD